MGSWRHLPRLALATACGAVGSGYGAWLNPPLPQPPHRPTVPLPAQAIFRPWRLPFVIDTLSKYGIRGLTNTPVKGVGVQVGDCQS